MQVAEPVPAPPPRPLVWPAFAAVCGWIFLQMMAGGAVAMWVTLPLIREAFVSRRAFDQAALQATVQGAIAQPSFLALFAAINAVSACAVALLAARAIGPGRIALGWLPARKGWLCGAATLVGALGLGELTTALMRWSGNENSVLIQMGEGMRRADPPGLVALVLTVGLGAGVAEEVLFRGLLQGRFAARWGPQRGVLLTALFFGVAHFDLWQGTMAALMGVLFGRAALVSKSIRPTVFAHVTNNTVAVLTARIEVEPGPWATPVAVAAVAVSAAVLWWLGREPGAASAEVRV